MLRRLAPLLVLLCLPGHAPAQGKTFTLATEEELAATGLLKFVVPRFALKHGIRPEILTGDPATLAASADLVIAERGTALALVEAGTATGGRSVFHTEGDNGTAYAMALVPESPNAAHATRFADWLTGEIGQRTVASFEADGQPRFIPGALAVAAPKAAEPTGDASEGERLAHYHCGRCHVVSDRNRMGGIGSTPSFAALRAIPGWEDKFLAFWSANPHPSFTQVYGVTEPFDPNHPPHIAPVEITLEDIEAIYAYAATIPPKNLGAQVQSR